MDKQADKSSGLLDDLNEALDALHWMVLQHCGSIYNRSLGHWTYHSRALGANADAMRALAGQGHMKLEVNNHRTVTGHFLMGPDLPAPIENVADVYDTFNKE